MDPNERLGDLMDALMNEDLDEAFDAAADLNEWIASGGFLPTATKHTWMNLLDGITHTLEEQS